MDPVSLGALALPWAGLAASSAGKIAADAWTAAMLVLWAAATFLLRMAFQLVDALTSPNVSETGPAATLYRTTFWVAAALVLILAAVQLGLAGVRRDGRSVATLLMGTAQFILVWAGWLGYVVVVVQACGSLTRGLLESLLHVDAWAAWQPWGEFDASTVTSATTATVLGLMGIFLLFGVIGYFLVMLARAGALVVLVATTPICAAGLVSEVGRAWFWKSLRWFHAAALSPVIMALVLGVGVSLSTGVTVHQNDLVTVQIAGALVGMMLIVISAFAPLALFKLLAFVDPGTSSGAAMRAGLDSMGGLHGALGRLGQSGGGSGGHGGQGGYSSGGRADGSSAATATDDDGTAAGMAASQAQTSNRFAGVMSTLGGVGAGIAALGGAAATLGGKGAVLGADLTNQMGVGHNSYQPDFSATRRRGGGPPDSRQQNGPHDDDNPDINGTAAGSSPNPPAVGTPAGGSGGATLIPQPPTPPWPPTPPTPPSPADGMSGTPGGAGPLGGGGSGGSAGGTAGGVEGAAAVAV